MEEDGLAEHDENPGGSKHIEMEVDLYELFQAWRDSRISDPTARFLGDDVLVMLNRHANSHRPSEPWRDSRCCEFLTTHFTALIP
jgi:hypothetical protein